jgi:hypothetical protein
MWVMGALLALAMLPPAPSATAGLSSFPDIRQVQERGALRVGLVAKDIPPLLVTGSDGQPAGIEVAMANGLLTVDLGPALYGPGVVRVRQEQFLLLQPSDELGPARLDRIVARLRPCNERKRLENWHAGSPLLHAARARWDYVESLSRSRILRTFPDHALAVGTIGSGWNFEASRDFGGGPEPCFMGPVRGGEKSGRGRFACEKQAAVHRSGQDLAESETSRPGVRVGSAREAVVAPGRRG